MDTAIRTPFAYGYTWHWSGRGFSVLELLCDEVRPGLAINAKPERTATDLFWRESCH